MACAKIDKDCLRYFKTLFFQARQLMKAMFKEKGVLMPLSWLRDATFLLPPTCRAGAADTDRYMTSESLAQQPLTLEIF